MLPDLTIVVLNFGPIFPILSQPDWACYVYCVKIRAVTRNLEERRQSISQTTVIMPTF